MKIFQRLNLSGRVLCRKILENFLKKSASRTDLAIQDVFSISYECSVLIR